MMSCLRNLYNKLLKALLLQPVDTGGTLAVSVYTGYDAVYCDG
jgi:hypothetical protein